MTCGRTLNWVALIASTGLLVFLCRIPVNLAIALYKSPQPEAILVLGGGKGREEAAAQLAAHYPKLDVWVSSGDRQPEAIYALFQSAGVATQRVYPDYRATDTVTNFTTLVPDFKQRGIQHLFIVTSDFHMPRSKAIATVILGSQGIAFTPVAISTQRAPESHLRIARDIGRSLLWLVTGKTGASWGQCTGLTVFVKAQNCEALNKDE